MPYSAKPRSFTGAVTSRRHTAEFLLTILLTVGHFLAILKPFYLKRSLSANDL